MRFEGCSNANNNKSKCLKCYEPIVKEEGRMKISRFFAKNSKGNYFNRTGFLCYKCSTSLIDSWIKSYKKSLEQLDRCNKLSIEKLNELKIGRML